MILVALFALGCGGPEAAIALRVEAPLVVPSDCDTLHVAASRAGASIFDRAYSLKTAFPQTLTLTTSNDADLGDPGVTVAVDALLGGQLSRPWAHASGQVTMVKGQLVPLTLQICDCAQ